LDGSTTVTGGGGGGPAVRAGSPEVRAISPHGGGGSGSGLGASEPSLARAVEELRTLVKLMRVELAQERTARERLEKDMATLRARLPPA
jgi:hypothetical protein